MAHRFFLSGPLSAESGQPLPLAAADLHHAVSVLRLRVGENVEVVEPAGEVLRAEVVSADDAGVVVMVLGPLGDGSRRLPHVTLFQGVAKGDKMDDIVRQAVEVGAEAIVPVMTSRTIVRLDPAKRASRAERWRRIAKSAAQQAKRASVPSVSEPVGFAEAIDLLTSYDRVVVLWEESHGTGLGQALSEPARRGRHPRGARGRPRGRPESRGGRRARSGGSVGGIARPHGDAHPDRGRGVARARDRRARRNGRLRVSAPFGVAFRTLGCKVNRVESEAIAAELLGRGVQVVEEAEALVVIVSTCTVTGEADAKDRKAIRHALAAGWCTNRRGHRLWSRVGPGRARRAR